MHAEPPRQDIYEFVGKFVCFSPPKSPGKDCLREGDSTTELQATPLGAVSEVSELEAVEDERNSKLSKKGALPSEGDSVVSFAHGCLLSPFLAFGEKAFLCFATGGRVGREMRASSRGSPFSRQYFVGQYRRGLRFSCRSHSLHWNCKSSEEEMRVFSVSERRKKAFLFSAFLRRKRAQR